MKSIKLENDLASVIGGKRNSSSTAMDVYDFAASSPPSSTLISKKIKPDKDMMASDLGISTSVVVDGPEQSSNSESGKVHAVDYDAPKSDMSYCDYGDDGMEDYGDDDDDDDYDDDASEYDDGNVEYLYEDSDLQAQFDNVDLPPGVEASVPWLVDPNPTESLKDGSENMNVASSSRVSESNSKSKNEEMMDDVLRKLMYFKQFDTVEDYSDHHYKNQGLAANHQPPKSWAKKIQEEWKILEENLPETIYVRAYESRMDLMRAAIIGPDGTPYHDGLFFFDMLFPSSYPHSPPLVHYHSGGLRINPNLYNCGKVCLSLLGTWSGHSTELWVPGKSTMLQVLVSIQALILNARPFFNEPGYETSYKGAAGDTASKNYSEQVFIYSLKTMMYSLKNPPKNFGDLVAGHFRIRAPDVMSACKVYSEGAEVGSNTRKIAKEGEKVENANSAGFKTSLAPVVKNLREAFIKNGSKDCEQ